MFYHLQENFWMTSFSLPPLITCLQRQLKPTRVWKKALRDRDCPRDRLIHLGDCRDDLSMDDQGCGGSLVSSEILLGGLRRKNLSSRRAEGDSCPHPDPTACGNEGRWRWRWSWDLTFCTHLGGVELTALCLLGFRVSPSEVSHAQDWLREVTGVSGMLLSCSSPLSGFIPGGFK